VAGKRGGFDDTRGTLFFEIARIAQQIKPRYLFLENVKGLLSHDQGNTFGTILYTLDELGYDAEWQVLNSKDFGVPQNRERVFIIGHLRGTGRREIFPIGRNDSEINEAKIIVAADLNHYGNDQMNRVYSPEGIAPTLTVPSGGGREMKIVQAVLTPDRVEKQQNGRRFKEDGEPMFTITAQDKHGIMLTRHEIKRETDISHCLMARDYKGIGNQEMTGVLEIREATKKGFAEAEPGDSVNYSVPTSNTRRGRVGKGIANTLDTGCQQGVVTEDIRIRKLTPRECWRLQGFPDWAFDKAREVNSDSQLYKQAGNSVTVNVIYEIAKRLGADE
jgi:DNA (cytosine-5)-methyltransferase 1